MDMFAHDARYWTVPERSNRDGSIGVKVHRERYGLSSEAAEVTYWDATGGIVVRTLEGDVPIEVIDEAAGEVRQLSGLLK